MYIATKDINSFMYGKIKKGDEAPFHQSWLNAGLIKEGHKSKPEPKKSKATKPRKSDSLERK